MADDHPTTDADSEDEYGEVPGAKQPATEPAGEDEPPQPERDD